MNPMQVVISSLSLTPAACSFAKQSHLLVIHLHLPRLQPPRIKCLMPSPDVAPPTRITLQPPILLHTSVPQWGTHHPAMHYLHSTLTPLWGIRNRPSTPHTASQGCGALLPLLAPPTHRSEEELGPQIPTSACRRVGQGSTTTTHHTITSTTHRGETNSVQSYLLP